MIALTDDWPIAALFANFTYTETNDVALANKPLQDEPLPPNVFANWQVSTPFDEKALAGKTTLSSANIDVLHWQPSAADNRGVANLNMLAEAQPGKNTVLAKITIHSEKAETKKLVFGFSDRVRLFFNDKLLYEGHDEYRSRDYRFLGTMGYYDGVLVDLKKGDNEIVMAISEDLGGWGVMAKLEGL